MGGHMTQSAKRFAHAEHGIDREPYHYKACGLDDVYLLNGYNPVETSYGKGVQIENIEVLHKAIASHLVMTQKALKPKEFRFLRKQLNLTQKELGDLMKITDQTVARYEKGECDIPATTDFTLRILCTVELMPNHKREEFLEDFKNILKSESAHHSQIFLRETAGDWNVSTVQ
jgi:transcriptional regulator with XRE-family HTH domain